MVGRRCFDARIESPLKSFASTLALLLLPAAGLLFAATAQDRRVAEAEAEITAAEIVAATPSIARQVEQIRGLRFEEVPRPRVIGTAELTRIFRREARRTGAAEELREGEILLELLGLVEPDEDLSGFIDALASDVAGAYDPDAGKLYVIRDAIPEDQAVVEVTLAHELTHALEDQVFDLKDSEALEGDRSLAYSALTEGTATAVMIQFAAERNLLGQLLLSDPGTSDIEDVPPVIRTQLVFPYLAGRDFVQELRRAGGDWDLVDVADRERPPSSTEQIIHPEKYLEGEGPVAVALAAGRVLGHAWERLDASDVGEFDLRQLMIAASGEAPPEVGWAGGRFSLWRHRRAPAECEDPCRERHVLVVKVAFDEPRQSAVFGESMGDYFEVLGGSRQAANTVDSGRSPVPRGAVAYVRRDRTMTLAFAPNIPLAERLASGS